MKLNYGTNYMKKISLTAKLLRTKPNCLYEIKILINLNLLIILKVLRSLGRFIVLMRSFDRPHYYYTFILIALPALHRIINLIIVNFFRN